MLSTGTIRKKIYTDSRQAKDYPNLITPNAFEKDLIVIAVLGYPERAGVWSYTLLRQSRTDESTMEPYFQQFQKNDIGLIAIDPNYFTPDIDGDSFVYQIQQVIADIPQDKKIGFIGFSMGGRILVDFLEQNPQLIDRTAGLTLIDPTLSNRLSVENIRPLLDNNTLLIASESDQTSPGEIASILLEIPKSSYKGIHGQMPNKALNQIIKFYKKRKP